MMYQMMRELPFGSMDTHFRFVPFAESSVNYIKKMGDLRQTGGEFWLLFRCDVRNIEIQKTRRTHTLEKTFNFHTFLERFFVAYLR